MSLVNRMLQDLDLRHASGAERAGLPLDLRPLPPPARQRRWPWVLAAAALCGMTAGTLAYAPWREPGTALRPRAEPVAPALRTAAPAVMPMPSQDRYAQVAATPPGPDPAATEPAPSRPAEEPSPSSESALRVATVLARLPESVPPPSPAARDAISAAGPLRADAAGAAKPGPSAAAPIAARAVVGSTPSPPASMLSPQIEKRERNVSARDRADGHYRRAVASLHQGRVGEALVAFEAALREDPQHVALRQAYASALVEERRRAEARAVLAEGLALAAEPQLALHLARLAMADGDDATALAALARAAAAAADDAEFRGLYAAVLARTGRHREAVGEYQAALQRVPGAGVWWMGLALSLEAEARSAEAREAFRRARASGALSTELTRFVDQRLKQLN